MSSVVDTKTDARQSSHDGRNEGTRRLIHFGAISWEKHAQQLPQKGASP